jgi:hypothetical protein
MRARLAGLVMRRIHRHGVTLRPPDFIIGEERAPYLLRWWLIPRNRWFNVYLHCFLRSDDDRALHDHPWCWLSLVLRGAYVEHTIAAGGIRQRRLIEKGALRFHRPRFAHRLEVIQKRGECWTLFVTGPRVRVWGFHCAERGWVDWRTFTDPANTGRTGKGCEA